jgi:hypothetical protein
MLVISDIFVYHLIQGVEADDGLMAQHCMGLLDTVMGCESLY